MPKETVTPTPKKKEKCYWVVLEANNYKEVTESELINNPQEYLGKQIWEKPPFEFELVVSLRKKSTT